MMVGYHDIMKKLSVVHKDLQINKIGKPIYYSRTAAAASEAVAAVVAAATAAVRLPWRPPPLPSIDNGAA